MYENSPSGSQSVGCICYEFIFFVLEFGWVFPMFFLLYDQSNQQSLSDVYIGKSVMCASLKIIREILLD